MAAKIESLLDDLVAGKPTPSNYWDSPKLKDCKAGRAILGLGRDEACDLIRLLLPRLHKLDQTINSVINRLGRSRGDTTPLMLKSRYERYRYLPVLGALLRRKLPLEAEDMEALIRVFRNGPKDCVSRKGHGFPIESLVCTIEFFAKDGGRIEKVNEGLKWLRKWLGNQTPDLQKLGERLDRAFGAERVVRIEPGEAWSDAVLVDLGRMKDKARSAWHALLFHCQAGGKGKLTKNWRKDAESLIDAIGFDSFKEHIARWLPLVDKPRTDSLKDHKPWMKAYEWYRHVGSIHEFQLFILPAHVEMLRGLAWCAGLREDADLARALTHLAISAYRKIPGVGPRLVSLGNACVTALGMMPGLPPIGQLAILKTKVKSVPAQKEIEKAFNAAAKRENLPREEIEELAVPSDGLEEVGLLRKRSANIRPSCPWTAAAPPCTGSKKANRSSPFPPP